MNSVKSIKAIAHIYPLGQKTDEAEIVYRAIIPENELTSEIYDVSGRNIVSIHVSYSGSETIVRILLGINDELAANYYFTSPDDDDVDRTPKAQYREPRLKIKQKVSLLTEDGTQLPAWENYMESDSAESPEVDCFTQDVYKGIPFNLYCPEGFQSSAEKLPLIIFNHDAGPNGSDPMLTLTQGDGGTIWARPEEQSKRPCFILAPQLDRHPRLVADRINFEMDPIIDIIFDLIQEISDRYPVDQNRIYLTGQSQGTCAALELSNRHPGFFAGGLLIAGQWEPKRTARGIVTMNAWVIVSEGDERACSYESATMDEVEKNGGTVGRYFWNGMASASELDKLVREEMEEPADVRFSVFVKGTVDTHGEDPQPDIVHRYTWPVVYPIEALREWLFAQRRKNSL